jgi:hypothetical protein
MTILRTTAFRRLPTRMRLDVWPHRTVDRERNGISDGGSDWSRPRSGQGHCEARLIHGNAPAARRPAIPTN